MYNVRRPKSKDFNVQCPKSFNPWWPNVSVNKSIQNAFRWFKMCTLSRCSIMTFYKPFRYHASSQIFAWNGSSIWSTLVALFLSIIYIGLQQASFGYNCDCAFIIPCLTVNNVKTNPTNRWHQTIICKKKNYTKTYYRCIIYILFLISAIWIAREPTLLSVLNAFQFDHIVICVNKPQNWCVV